MYIFQFIALLKWVRFPQTRMLITIPLNCIKIESNLTVNTIKLQTRHIQSPKRTKTHAYIDKQYNYKAYHWSQTYPLIPKKFDSQSILGKKIWICKSIYLTDMTIYSALSLSPYTKDVKFFKFNKITHGFNT